jgi:hypothetical protein
MKIRHLSHQYQGWQPASYIMKTKPIRITKILMAVLTVFAFLVVTVSQTAKVEASSALTNVAPCQGDNTQCVCPTTGSDANTDCGVDPALTTCSSPTDCNLVIKYLNPFIKLLSIITGTAVVIGIIVGAIQYSASGGDPQKTASAKKHIRNAILGLIAFIFLFAFLKFLAPGIAG